MKVGKSFVYSNQNTETRIQRLEQDMTQLFTVLQGRISFGTGTDGFRGENVEGRFQQFTSHATPDTEFSVAHGLGATPVGRIIFWQDKNGVLYQGPSTGTAWDSTNAYFKCTVASVTFLVFFTK